MLRWPDYLADPPSDTTSGDVNPESTHRTDPVLHGSPRPLLHRGAQTSGSCDLSSIRFVLEVIEGVGIEPGLGDCGIN
jgi:hypothetical protein